jgi:outer membrane protein assembly factor BamB
MKHSTSIIHRVAIVLAACAALAPRARPESPSGSGEDAEKVSAKPVPESMAEATVALAVVPSPEPGWPQFRGPRRDGKSDETGLLQSWPEGGPRLIWSASGLGSGYSSPIIVRGRMYVSGEEGDELRVFALDTDGKLLWRSRNGKAWKGSYPGARASCTYADGRLYHRNAHGRVACLDAETGKELWAVDVLERFEGRNITWALGECLLVDGKQVFVTAGGRKALVCTLHADTGETLWASEPLLVEPPDGGSKVAESASYSSPLLCQLGDRRILFGASLRHHFAADAASGRILYTVPIRTAYSVIVMTPLLCGDGIFITAPDTEDGGLYRLRSSGTDLRAIKAWSTALDTCHGGTILDGGRIYGTWYREKQGWACLDAATGKILYESLQLGMGSILHADRRLYCLSQEGEMALLEPARDGFRFHGRFRLPGTGRRKDAWAHPVILDGRLYLRYHDAMYAYDIRADSTGAAGAR